ncbi:MAG TPA: VOC family protein [Ignavibacteriaceae bacterium]|nr:VOC family protein [Ignavibacteriaceae bacterium]
MNGYIYFEIQADDVQRAVDFYKNIFGWKITRAQEEIPIEYWRIETRSKSGQAGGTRGGLLKRPAKAPPPQSGTNAFVCSIEVENFDETAKKILKQGGQVALPKFAVPGVCWQGYFLDQEGNTFGIFQVDENAK